jgi:hypothetical protein
VRRLVGVVALLSAAGACRDSAGSRPDAGLLQAEWSGADTGDISSSATAEWCDEQRLLEIRAIRGDTGLALAVYPGVILSADSYPVLAPSRSDSTVPSARVALRWFGATAINGFQGDSGAVVVSRTDSGRLSGTVEARASSVTNSDRIYVTGTFRDLTVVDAARGCAPPDSAADQDVEPADIADVDDVD